MIPKSIAGAVAIKEEFKGRALEQLAASFPDDTDVQDRFLPLFDATFDKALRDVYTPASSAESALDTVEGDLKPILEELKGRIYIALQEERDAKDYYERWKLVESDYLMDAVRRGFVEVPLRNLIGKTKPLKKRLDFAEAIRGACNDAGLNALDFSDRCSSRMTVKSFYQVKFALIDHLRANPNDVVFFTQDAAEWVGFYQTFTAVKDNTLSAVAFHGEDYAHLANTLRDDVAVKQALSSITIAALECCICMNEITSEGGGVVLNTAAPFVCGHQICMVCAKNFDDVCPTCRETRRFDLINTKAKSSKKPHSGSRRGRR